ncbi:glycosyl transferase [Burkholderia pseudomallei]|uniref:glycosyltransferase family 9 protein n=1 Tax=Burkholderia pseudomallei TaxID=28450 RepID=UPI000976C241|nr:glycosyltransferase family 9 protein [Burkholderia pseudomallei]OMT59078.1 glycosyl transferase [Burkholderia pseudomallei]OMZ30823.1 glycosyl transferase [Burkholderia pseudomallei]OMZ37702.1 glycosyl transferase [Burkholderia pseudomallei]
MSPAERAMTLHAWRRARRILCVRLDNMGDVLMTTPALRALKESGEGRHLTLLTSSAAAPLAAHLPMIDDVWIYDAPWVKHPGADDGAAADVAMIERLLCGGFDAAAIFTVYSQSPLPAAMMCRLAGIALRLAHCRENPYRLLTERIAETEPQVQLRHEVARQLALVREVGATPRDMRLAFEPGDAARRAVRARLRAARLAWRAQAEGGAEGDGRDRAQARGAGACLEPDVAAASAASTRSAAAEANGSDDSFAAHGGNTPIAATASVVPAAAAASAKSTASTDSTDSADAADSIASAAAVAASNPNDSTDPPTDLGRWLVVHPGASAASRRWPAERFADVVARVARYFDGVAVTGGAHERALVETVCARAGKRVLPLAGALSIGELGALIEAADLLLANNSGPVHLAAALGTPVVDLYALTNPQHTPWRVPSRVLNADVPCRHCYRSVCDQPGHPCLERVSVDDVVAAVRELMRETTGSHGAGGGGAVSPIRGGAARHGTHAGSVRGAAAPCAVRGAAHARDASEHAVSASALAVRAAGAHASDAGLSAAGASARGVSAAGVPVEGGPLADPPHDAPPTPPPRAAVPSTASPRAANVVPITSATART